MARSAPKAIRLRASAAFLAALVATASSSVSAAPPPPEKHFVWRVTNLPVPFYLVGSIHNLAPRDYPLPKVYRSALTNSQRLLFEYNPRERDALTRKFREVAKYPAGQDIESEIRPATLGLLKKNAWRFRMKFDQMRRYRPWAIALLLLAEQGPLGASSPRSMDSYLSRALGLLFDKTRDAWKRGDVAALAAANARLHRANPGIAQSLLDRRNARWVARIEAEMKTGKPTAIVAGTGHFSGPWSVIELLRERGYRIEQL